MRMKINVKQSVHDSMNRATDHIKSIDPASINWGEIIETVKGLWNADLIKRLKAAMRERGYMIDDAESIFDTGVLSREVSRKSGIQFSDITSKDAVVADLDHFISAKFNDALGTDVSGLSSADGFKAAMVDMIVAQVANGRMVEVMSRVTAGVIRKGVVYSKSFTGQPLAFDLAKHARKLDNRKYMIKYRNTHKQIWD